MFIVIHSLERLEFSEGKNTNAANQSGRYICYLR